MRFNFKKVVSVLTSVVMLGSTAAMAAAANYPAPFVEGGAANVAVVVGANAPLDIPAAVELGQDLQAALSSQTGTGTTTTSAITASGGDSLKIEKSTNKLNANDALTGIWTTKITDADMPNLLADGTYRSKDNIDYKYEQYLEFEGSAVNELNFTHFDDDDYKKDTPSLGLKIASNTKIMNYTLDFSKDVRTDVSSSGRLEDMEDRDIVIMGKTYKLLNAYNKSSDTKFELMRGSVSSTINLNEEKTINVEGKGDYTITLVFVDSDEVQFEIIDSEGTSQTTNKLVKGGTEKLSDGTQIGVTDLSYQAFSGGVMSGEFTLGANKLTLENGQVMEIDDVDENDIGVTIIRSEVDSNKVDIQKIVLQWTADDEMFVAGTSEAVMPGFSAVKLKAGAVTKACEESVKVKSTSTYGIELTVPIKDGDAKINLLYGNATDYTVVGEKDDSTGFLRTANDTGGDFMRFDRDTDAYFIASYNSTTEAESYKLRISTTSDSDGTNYTTIENMITGTKYESKKAGDVVTIGNVQLNVIAVFHGLDANSKDHYVDLGAGSGVTFNRIYTAGGLGIWLPINTTGWEPSQASDSADWGVLFNETDGADASADLYQGTPSWMLMMSEEDKDGNLGSGSVINVTLGHASSEAEPTEVAPNTAGNGGFFYSAGGYKEIGSTKIHEGYVASDLGSKVLFNKPNTGTNDVEVVYHCSQMYGNIFVTAPDVTISGGGTTSSGGSTLGAVTVFDNEVSKISGKNLIVLGGSCVNSAAAKILGVTKPTCSGDFTTASGIGADQFLIKVVDAASAGGSSGKVAMLVAGYEAADTVKAVKYLTTEVVPSDTGTEIKKVTATYENVV